MRRIFCPRCGANEIPVERICGYPDDAAAAAIERGDAVALGCMPPDGPSAPVHCRVCRTHLIPSDLEPELIAIAVLGEPTLQVAAGVWLREARSAVVVLAWARRSGVTVAAAAVAALRGARRRRVAILRPGWPVLVAYGRDLDRALQEGLTWRLEASAGLAATVGHLRVPLALRPPRSGGTSSRKQ